jgi:hypothetical protein
MVGLFSTALRPRRRWLLCAFLLWGLLFVVVAGFEPSFVRGLLTGGWYNDFKRIAAGCVLVTFLIGVGGLRSMAHWIRMGWRHSSRQMNGGRSVPAAAAVVLTAVVGGVSLTTNVRQAATHAASNYNLAPGSPIMSPDELALYRQLDSLVPSDATIAGNPWDGSAWAYFVSGRHILFPHVLTPWTYEMGLIAGRLNEAAADPLVCTAVRRLNIRYALTSDELIYLPGNPQTMRYPGMAGLELAKGFELVASVGSNRLFRVTACW